MNGHKKIFIISIFNLFFLIGCSNKVSPANSSPYVSVANLVEKYGEIISNDLYKNPRLILNKLVLKSNYEVIKNKQIHLIIINKLEFNAYTTAEDVIILTKGLIDKCQNEEQLAFIIAHELGHIILGQYSNQLNNEDLYQIESQADLLAKELLKSAEFSLYSPYNHQNFQERYIHNNFN
jgi:PBP1b-binding outer membrane lipoprotein LpoB